MDSFLKDLRYGARILWKTKGLALVAVASLAVGIGTNAAIFTLVDQVLLRVLRVHNPHELVQVTFQGSRYGSNWGDGSQLSYPVYAELRDHNDVFSGMFGSFGYSFHVATSGRAGRTERVAGEIVTGSYFPVLGVGAALGRTLTPEDDKLPGGSLAHADRLLRTPFGCCIKCVIQQGVPLCDWQRYSPPLWRLPPATWAPTRRSAVAGR